MDIKAIIRPAGIVVGMILTVGSRVLDGVDARQLGLPFWAWETIGLGIFFVSVIAVLYNFSKGVGQKHEKGISSDNIKCYANRTVLIRERGQLGQELKMYAKVWVIWHEGLVVTQSDEIKHCNIQRAILTDPEDTYVMKRYSDRWSKLNEIDTEGVRLKSTGIKVAASIMRNQGTDVRFYEGFTSCTLVLADKINLSDNQFSNDSWARIESGIPFGDTTNRPSIIITKAKSPEQFEALRQHYLRMWESSRPSI